MCDVTSVVLYLGQMKIYIKKLLWYISEFRENELSTYNREKITFLSLTALLCSADSFI